MKRVDFKIWIPVIVAVISGIFVILKTLLEKESYFSREIEEATLRSFIATYPSLVNQAYSTMDSTKFNQFCTGENLKVNLVMMRELKNIHTSTMEINFALFELQDFNLKYINNVLNASIEVKTDATRSYLRNGKKYRCIKNTGTSTFFVIKTENEWKINAIKPQKESLTKTVVNCQ